MSMLVKFLVWKLLSFSLLLESSNLVCVAGLKNREFSAPEECSSSNIFCSNRPNRTSAESTSESVVNLDKLAEARKMGILDQSPVDEVEGELIYLQQRLLHNAVSRKRLTGLLLFLLIFLEFVYSFIYLCQFALKAEYLRCCDS